MNYPHGRDLPIVVMQALYVGVAKQMTENVTPAGTSTQACATHGRAKSMRISGVSALGPAPGAGLSAKNLPSC